MANGTHGSPTSKRRLHFNLRWKIMLTVAVVAFGVLTVAAIHSYKVNQSISRAEILTRQQARFEGTRRAIGRYRTAAVAIAASEPTLGAALAANDLASAARIGTRLTRALGQSLDTELVALVDRNGATIASFGNDARDIGETASRLVVDIVQDGLTIDSEIAVLRGEVAYQTSGVPVRDSERRIVGALIVGERLDDFLALYRDMSNTAPEKQLRSTLLDTRNQVIASSFPRAKHAALSKALARMPRVKVDDAGAPSEVIDLDGELHYFHPIPVEGYYGSQHGSLGQLYLMRSRADQQQDFVDRVESSIVLFVVVGIAALLVGFILSYQITKRIHRYVQATEDLAKGRGDLTQRLSVSGGDELGRLAENLNAVFGHTHDLAVKVSRAAFQVGASSAEISAASKQMLEGAQEQARKTEGSTAAVTELSASIQQVAENALEATRVARSSGQAVESAIERMNEIRGTVEEAASRMKDLGESGKRIGNIVEVIRQISDQTTLLALNAAIEAAHAGEQGRGFAVVADEVSSLAKRVGQSARDIEDLIATIKEQTLEAMKAMEAGTREVEAGTTLVTHTLADLRTLVQVVEDTAKAVQEQAVASDEIARNMDVVQRIAQDVLSSSVEAVEQGDHLHRLAHGLEESVKGFKIDPATRSGDSHDGDRPLLTSGDRRA